MESLDTSESFMTALSQPCSQTESCGIKSQLDQHLAKALESIKQADKILDENALRKGHKKADARSDAQRNTRSDETEIDPSLSDTAIKKCVGEALRAVDRAQAGLNRKKALKTYKMLKATLTNASSLAPDIRLVVAYPHQSNQNLSGDSIVFLETVGDRDLFGITHSKDQVDCSFKLPFDQKNSTGLQYQLRILFIPTSDKCLLILEPAAEDTNIEHTPKDNTEYSTDKIRIANPYIEEKTLESSMSLTIYPDVWNISLWGDENNNPGIDFLLLERQFNITTRQSKRKAADYIGNNRSAKRLRTESSNMQTTDPMDLFRNPHNIVWSLPSVSSVNITIPELLEGYTAFINSRAGGEDYQLRRRRLIFRSQNSLVFNCEHSVISTTSVPNTLVVAKVLLGTNNYIHTAKIWKREKTVLAKLSHENIVKLVAFDGRLFSLYLEKLPPSLVHKDQELQRPFPPLHALKILQGISSALKYLTIQNVIHFDIKGGNIAYSPSCPRGAVLFDFNLACVGNKDDAEQTQGTRWYVPPEFLDNERGRAGDIWALGVTMLDIMGKIERPESTGDWNLGRARSFGSADYGRMEEWLGYIGTRRRALGGQKLESLVFRMLDPNAELRVEAAELEEQAAAIELSE